MGSCFSNPNERKHLNVETNGFSNPMYNPAAYCDNNAGHITYPLYLESDIDGVSTDVVFDSKISFDMDMMDTDTDL